MINSLHYIILHRLISIGYKIKNGDNFCNIYNFFVNSVRYYFYIGYKFTW